MTRYMLGRFGQTLIVLFGVSIMIFFLLRMIPGSPTQLMFADGDGEGGLSVAGRAQYERGLGFDRSLFAQFVDFFSGVVRGDLGTSLLRNRSVTSMIGDALPLTIELAVASIAIAVIISVPIAVLGALKQNTFMDRGGTAFALIGTSMPSFWQGIMLIFLFAVTFPILPVSGVIDVGLSVRSVTGLPILDALLTGNWEALKSLLLHLVLPAVTLGTSVAASFTRVLRSSLLEVKHQDFVDALRARGLAEGRVVGHMVRNALPTAVVVFGIRLGALLGGTLVIETVFAYPGMGWLLINAINNRDYPVVQGVVLVLTLMVVLVNLGADLLHGWLDPRLKLSTGAH